MLIKIYTVHAQVIQIIDSEVSWFKFYSTLEVTEEKKSGNKTRCDLHFECDFAPKFLIFLWRKYLWVSVILLWTVINVGSELKNNQQKYNVPKFLNIEFAS